MGRLLKQDALGVALRCWLASLHHLVAEYTCRHANVEAIHTYFIHTSAMRDADLVVGQTPQMPP